MRLIPRGRNDAIDWFARRLTAWTDDPESIGLTEAQVQRLAELLEAARVAGDAVETARRAATAARPAFLDAADDLRDYGAQLTKIIRAHADATGDAEVYTRSLVRPDAEPAPRPAPAPPADVRGRITAAGHVELTWRASIAHGAVFVVERRLVPVDHHGLGDWSILDAVHATGYLDTRIPLGLAAAQYRLRARRGLLFLAVGLVTSAEKAQRHDAQAQAQRQGVSASDRGTSA